MTDGGSLVRGNALQLPFADNSVDLVVTSPPYFALRSYQDGGEHYGGQIGSEPTPGDFIAALLEVTAECARVLKPSGSIFVNLGDKYAGSGGHNNAAIGGTGRGPAAYNKASGGVPAKSLMMLPERYRIGCVDRLGLIARAVVVWDKPNGLPESVTDRVRRSHEDWVHLTKRGSYYAAVDEIREAQKATGGTAPEGRHLAASGNGVRHRTYQPNSYHNPLGKLPGSVWTVPTEPLQVPDFMAVRHPKDMRPPFLDEKGATAWARHHGLDVDGHPVSPWPRPNGPHLAAAPDHFAAFPTEWPRRLILGWSPPGVCQGCGEGRRPVAQRASSQRHNNGKHGPTGLAPDNRHGRNNSTLDVIPDYRITGYACACPDTSAPTRPAVILDPFAGTGTTVLVARALGRMGVGVDLSADYLRLAGWRVTEHGAWAKVRERTYGEKRRKPPPEPLGMGSLFDLAGG